MANHKIQDQQGQDNQEEYPLVYNMWIENLTINCQTCILQTGKPTDPPPPANGEDNGEGDEG